MLKFIGAVFIICGSTGLGFACRRDMVAARQHTGYLQKLMELLQSEVQYARASLPEACRTAAQQLPEPYRTALCQIGRRMEPGNGLSFSQVWEEETGKLLQLVPVPAKEGKLLLHFAEQCGFADCNMQLRILTQYADLYRQSVDRQEEGILKKGKAAASIGLLGGIMLTVVLL